MSNVPGDLDHTVTMLTLGLLDSQHQPLQHTPCNGWSCQPCCTLSKSRLTPHIIYSGPCIWWQRACTDSGYLCNKDAHHTQLQQQHNCLSARHWRQQYISTNSLHHSTVEPRL